MAFQYGFRNDSHCIVGSKHVRSEVMFCFKLILLRAPLFIYKIGSVKEDLKVHILKCLISISFLFNVTRLNTSYNMQVHPHCFKHEDLHVVCLRTFKESSKTRCLLCGVVTLVCPAFCTSHLHEISFSVKTEEQMKTWLWIHPCLVRLYSNSSLPQMEVGLLSTTLFRKYYSSFFKHIDSCNYWNVDSFLKENNFSYLKTVTR